MEIKGTPEEMADFILMLQNQQHTKAPSPAEIFWLEERAKWLKTTREAEKLSQNDCKAK